MNMKKLISNSLKVVIVMIAFGMGFVFPAGAQTLAAQLEDKEIPLSEFNSIDVEDNFEVTLVKGTYGMRLTVDKELAPYVEKYVKSRTLHLSYDVKSVPKEVKKLYKGKNAIAPVFRAVISLPELEAITLSDNATVTGTEVFNADKFTLTLSDKSVLKSLTVNARTAYLVLHKNAQAVLDLNVEGSAELIADGNSSIKLTATARELAINTANAALVSAQVSTDSMNLSSAATSQLSLDGTTQKAFISAEGSAKLNLSGAVSEKMQVKTSRNAHVDAMSLQSRDVEANCAGSSDLIVAVSGILDVTLSGGSALYYTGTPEFRIGKVIKSTLAPYGTK